MSFFIQKLTKETVSVVTKMNSIKKSIYVIWLNVNYKKIGTYRELNPETLILKFFHLVSLVLWCSYQLELLVNYFIFELSI